MTSSTVHALSPVLPPLAPSPPRHPAARLARLGTRAIGLTLTLGLAAACASMPDSVRAWRGGLRHATTVDGHQLAYVDRGRRDGEVILLLHGLPTSSQLYRQVIPDLVDAGYRVLAPDLIGYGASSKPGPGAAYDMKQQAVRLRAWLDQLGVARVTLVVHDIGGLVGWELLDADPSRVARLLVLNTTAYPTFDPPKEMKQLAGWMGRPMMTMMTSWLVGQDLTAAFIRDNTGDPARADWATIDGVWWSLREGTTRPMRQMARSFDLVKREFTRYQTALRGFDGPTSIVWGGRDRILRFDDTATAFARDLRVPAARVRRLDDAGHFVVLDHPEVVAAAVLELMGVATPTPASAARAGR